MLGLFALSDKMLQKDGILLKANFGITKTSLKVAYL